MVQGIPPPVAATILIVEDDEDTREFLTLAITTETPYHVFSLGSATETFQRLNEIQAAKPALLILDYRLTSMTALELYDRLSVTAELKKIPTIIITADHLNEETRRALAARNIRLLEKPFDLNELISCIGQAVQPGDLLVIDTQDV
jgi:CheY-like chemotaxis protein